MTGDEARRGCIDEAAILVATHSGAADRLRERHRRRADGCCTGCGPGHVRWPCVQIVIADRSSYFRR